MSGARGEARAARVVAWAQRGCLVAVVGALASTVSCASSPDTSRVTDVIVPDFDIYKANVDRYLERRCGSLDCHGQPGRAYRIYSREGFRDYAEQDGGLASGQQPTTDLEILANFEAFVSVEPEQMTRVMAAQGADPNSLVVLRKPLKLERHKGGPAMALDDDGYRCVVGWLQVPVVNPDGTDTPKPRTLPDKIVQLCQNAQNFP